MGSGDGGCLLRSPARAVPPVTGAIARDPRILLSGPVHARGAEGSARRHGRPSSFPPSRRSCGNGIIPGFVPCWDGGEAMSKGQCWSVQGDGARCAGPAEPGGLFCSRHRHVRAADVSRVWLAPEAEMPRELVATLRHANPALRFPDPEPSSRATVAASMASSPPFGSSPTREATPIEPAAPEGASGSAELEWLLALLRAAMEGVMAGEGTPLLKASAVARLAGQYLKAYGAGERRRENQALTRRLKAAEARVAVLEARLAAAERPPATPKPEEAVPPAVSLKPEPERERQTVPYELPDHGWVDLGRGEPLAARAAASDPVSTAGAIAGRESVPA
jgi:hypothetical protein